MITFLHGKLVDVLPTQVVIDVHGVGYEVLIPLSSFDRLPSPGQEITLLTHLAIREDAVGNLFARWSGAEPDLPAVATGSHIDAIPHAGRYDGTVGVLGGLEAIRALQRACVHPRRSIELLMFTAEEPTRFGIGCFGSRLLAGVLDPATLRDQDGRTLADWRGETVMRSACLEKA